MATRSATGWHWAQGFSAKRQFGQRAASSAISFAAHASHLPASAIAAQSAHAAFVTAAFAFVQSAQEAVYALQAAQCAVSARKPTGAEINVNAKNLNEAMFQDASNFGAQFANKISVKCP